MSNWAYGIVRVLGTKKNVISFINRFISSDGVVKPRTNNGHRCFYGSMTDKTLENLHKDIEQFFNGLADLKEAIYEFDASFIWSAAYCIIQDNLQEYPECITLADACKEDQVSVEIMTVEQGMWFEESITCDKNGNTLSTRKELPPCMCEICRTAMQLHEHSESVESNCGSENLHDENGRRGGI